MTRGARSTSLPPPPSRRIGRVSPAPPTGLRSLNRWGDWRSIPVLRKRTPPDAKRPPRWFHEPRRRDLPSVSGKAARSSFFPPGRMAYRERIPARPKKQPAHPAYTSLENVRTPCPPITTTSTVPRHAITSRSKVRIRPPPPIETERRSFRVWLVVQSWQEPHDEHKARLLALDRRR